jgi:hypothetical protein
VEALPDEIRADLADALARLDAGLSLSMPLSRPMPSIWSSEISIHVLHAFKKTTQATPQRTIAVVKRRLREVIA